MSSMDENPSDLHEASSLFRCFDSDTDSDNDSENWLDKSLSGWMDEPTDILRSFSAREYLSRFEERVDGICHGGEIDEGRGESLFSDIGPPSDDELYPTVHYGSSFHDDWSQRARNRLYPPNSEAACALQDEPELLREVRFRRPHRRDTESNTELFEQKKVLELLLQSSHKDEEEFDEAMARLVRQMPGGSSED